MSVDDWCGARSDMCRRCSNTPAPSIRPTILLNTGKPIKLIFMFEHLVEQLK